MTMSSGLYGFASLKGEVGVEAGRSWLVLEGKSILTYRVSGVGPVWLETAKPGLPRSPA